MAVAHRNHREHVGRIKYMVGVRRNDGVRGTLESFPGGQTQTQSSQGQSGVQVPRGRCRRQVGQEGRGACSGRGGSGRGSLSHYCYYHPHDFIQL